MQAFVAGVEYADRELRTPAAQSRVGTNRTTACPVRASGEIGRGAMPVNASTPGHLISPEARTGKLFDLCRTRLELRGLSPLGFGLGGSQFAVGILHSGDEGLHRVVVSL